MDLVQNEPGTRRKIYNVARSNTHLLCKDVPCKILKECSYSGDEPTQFVSTFLETGHIEWLFKKYGHKHFERERIDRAILVIWFRACEMYICHISNMQFTNVSEMFFSDEGLY
ncbi:MAG: hypothetical protein VX643_06160 [Chloroflexota bacterium]|nr:hypothetical protein [Chloroflexota bacterium]